MIFYLTSFTIVTQKFATSAQDYLRLVVSDHDHEIRKMRLLLDFEAPISYPSVIRENAAFAESSKDEPTKRIDSGVFHLILILRLLDISMFHEGKGNEGTLVKIPKRLQNPIDLMAS
jgi:hypothetical protein